MLVWFAVLAVLGIVQIASAPRRARGGEPAARGAFFARNGGHGLLVLGSGGPGGHRRRGALRGHGPLRAQADPARLVRGGLSGAAAQLLRAGRAAARAAPSAAENPFYLLAPAWALLSAGRAGDARHGDRLAGAHLRGVLADAAGGAARLLAARAHRPHLRRARSGRSTCPRSTGRCSACRGPGARLRVLEPARRGVRHRGDRHDGDHLGAVLLRGAAYVWKTERRARGRGARALPDRRPGVPRRQRCRRSRTAAGCPRARRGGVHRHGDLEARPPAARRTAARHDDPARGAAGAPGGAAARAGAGHGRVHDGGLPARCRRPSSTTSPTTGAAREGDPVDRDHRAQAARARRRVHGGEAGGPGDPRRPRALRLHAGGGRAPRPARLPRSRLRPRAGDVFPRRETLLATPVPGMAIWREKLFAFVSRNALRATAYYRIPPDRVFEVGVEVQL